MSAPQAPVTTATTTTTTAAAKGADALASKVQKYVDSLTVKIQKLGEENTALKAQLHEAKASNSRIRRIPKKAGVSAAAVPEPAQA